MFKNIFKNNTALKTRNFLNLYPTYFNINYLEKGISYSDGFFWRLDENYKTKVRFLNIINFFYKIKSDVEIHFFDNEHNFLNKIKFTKNKLHFDLVITKKIVKKEGYGVFYIFHKSNKKFNSIIRNSCYVGYSFKNSIYSYVHGNTPTSKVDVKNKKKVEINVSSLSFFRKKYIVQNNFLNKKIEIMFQNSLPITQKIIVNEKKLIVKKGHIKLLSIDNCELVSITSNSYLLRPIIFEKKINFVDVYHG